jgi:hypothetical protein
MTQHVIAKPAFKKPAPAPTPAPKPEPAKPQAGACETLFQLMDDNKVSEDDILAFVESKGMKAPSYVADLTLPTMKRLVDIFDQVIAFGLNK